jgi:hypothetical protein
MEQESTDHIMETQVKGTLQQNIQLYRVDQSRAAPAPRQVAHPGPNSTKISSSELGELSAMERIYS